MRFYFAFLIPFYANNASTASNDATSFTDVACNSATIRFVKPFNTLPGRFQLKLLRHLVPFSQRFQSNELGYIIDE